MRDLVFVIIFVLIIFVLYCWLKYFGTKPDNHPASNSFPKSKPRQYRQIIKSTSDKDNMNCTMYIFSGKYSETNRIRKNKTAYVFNGEKPMDVIVGMGYSDPIEYDQSDFSTPTKAQMDYLYDLSHGQIPKNVSFDDASALIGRYVEGDNKVPNPQLFHFAEQMHIPVSFYCGKKRLYNLIFTGLEGQDKIAFFIFQVYRDYYNEHDVANMNDSPRKHLFYEFAKLKMNDESFMKSLNKYSGESLRIFGTHTYNGVTVSGGSKNTIAYKEALAFLKQNI